MTHPRRVKGTSNDFYVTLHENFPHYIFLVDDYEGLLLGPFVGCAVVG